MTGPLKLIGGVFALAVLLALGLYAYRAATGNGRTPEGYQLLTAVPNAESFEPSTMPAKPVLANHSTTDLAVNFGYEVGGIPYSYSLDLSFPATADPAALDEGHAKVTVHHASRSTTVDTTTTRLWDAPRKAYAVAIEDKFDVEPAVPSLCIKAVIGPTRTASDMKDSSLCIAQRDARGTCHPETLACGLIHQ